MGVNECSPIFETVIEDKVYLAQGINNLPVEIYRCFRTQGKLRYHAFCDDFGPFNMANIFAFIELLDQEIEQSSKLKIVYCVEMSKRAMSNAVFLLGAYMILKLNMSAQAVIERFNWADDRRVEPFRDATHSVSNFHLTLDDCWRAFDKAKSKMWVQLPSDTSGDWGRIDRGEYEQYDDPLNADLHEVVPGKFIAFKGPKDLGDSTYMDDQRGLRHFSPDHYADIFKALGVTTIIRLNEPEYDASSFAAHGFAHHDLEFEDCTAPPHRIVQAFFRIADAAPGAVAVHCKAGLGRTGTLIALALMRHHAFAAREAIAWLRLMRPGSVIGQQQHYLCEVERCVAAARGPPPHPPPAHSPRRAPSAKSSPQLLPALPPAAAPPLSEVRGPVHCPPPPSPPPAGAVCACAHAPSLAAQVAAGMERRGAARRQSLKIDHSAGDPAAPAGGRHGGEREQLPAVRGASPPLTPLGTVMAPPPLGSPKAALTPWGGGMEAGGNRGGMRAQPPPSPPPEGRRFGRGLIRSATVAAGGDGAGGYV